MNEQMVRQIVQQEMQKRGDLSSFSALDIPRHIHNGSDAPYAYNPILTYIGSISDPGQVIVTASGAFSGGEFSATLSSAWPYSSGVFPTTFSNGDIYNVTYVNGSTAITWGLTVHTTTTFAGGEVTATLNAVWPDASGVIPTVFSNGNIRNVGYMAGVAGISWTGALSSSAGNTLRAYCLSSAATSSLSVIGPAATVDFLPSGWSFDVTSIGLYKITHNLNSTFYGVSAISSGSSTDTYPLCSPFANYFELTFINSNSGVATPTPFLFSLTTTINSKPGFPAYTNNT